MEKLPEEICQEWKNREDAVVFTTVDTNGAANSIYVGCVGIFNDRQIVIADNYFEKTRENILNGSDGCILFLTKDRKSYQIKGSIEYHKTGELFDFMKSSNPEKHPGHAAAVLIPEKVYSGAKQIC